MQDDDGILFFSDNEEVAEALSVPDRDDGVAHAMVLSIAGHQRTNCHWVVKDLMAEFFGFPRKKGALIQAMRDAFSALELGGPAPTTPDPDGPTIELPSAPNAAAIQARMEVELLSEVVVKTLSSSEPERRKQIEEVLKASERLHEAAEGVVSTYAAHFSKVERATTETHRAIRDRVDGQLRIVAADVQGMVAELGTIAHELTETATGQSGALEQLALVCSRIQEQAVRSTEALRGLKGVVDRVEEAASETKGCVGDTQMLCEGAHTAISRLYGHAQAIDRNVATIDEVASRTRLLALNARIEAERAGEAGSGFRIVADEVKHLAKASSTASHTVDSDLGQVKGETSTVMECVRDVLGAIEKVAALSEKTSSSVASHGPVALQVEASIDSTFRAASEIAEKAQSFGSAADKTSSKAMSIKDVSRRLISTSAKIGDLLSELRM